MTQGFLRGSGLKNALVHESLRLSFELVLQWRFLRFFSQDIASTMVFLSLARSHFGEHLPLFIGENVLTLNSQLIGLIPILFMSKFN